MIEIIYKFYFRPLANFSHNAHFLSNLGENKYLVADMLNDYPSHPLLYEKRFQFGLGWQCAQAQRVTIRVTLINEKPIEMTLFPLSRYRLTSHKDCSLTTFCHESGKVVPVFEQ
jgi:hypothetical protein